MGHSSLWRSDVLRLNTDCAGTFIALQSLQIQTSERMNRSKGDADGHNDDQPNEDATHRRLARCAAGVMLTEPVSC